MVPNPSNWWESKAVFNCSVLNDGKNIHMLYRAIGEYEDYVSRIGYASSNDGLSFIRRKEPSMYPEMEYESFGIEDPRLTIIDGENYVTYVVLSNYVRNNPSVSSALARTNDFFNYEKLGIITVEGSQDKDVVLFPKSDGHSELGKYMILHRPSSWIGPEYNTDRPSIWIAEGDSSPLFYARFSLTEPSWSVKVGTGVPPISTKKGGC